MKKIKRIISLLMTLCLIFSAVSVLNLNVTAAENVWDGSVADSFAGGDGSETSPYQIANGEQLAYFASLINAHSNLNDRTRHYQLTADIDLGGIEWTPISTAYSSTQYLFAGTFDGNGHTISNLSITGASSAVGLFGEVTSATIKNLTIKNASINTSGHYLGTIVGQTIASTTISNCHVIGSFIRSSSYCAGGIVGYAEGASGTTLTITQCSFKDGSVYSYTHGAGGIIGGAVLSLSSNYLQTNISECFCADSTIIASAYGGAGGIVGISRGRLAIANCYNTSSVTCDTPANSSAANYYGAAGGIAGFVSNANTSISYCYNTGDITCATSARSYLSYGGGIAGYTAGLTITSCFNSGDVSTKNTSATYKSTTGTIRGYSGGSISDCFYLSGCLTASTSYSTHRTEGTQKSSHSDMVSQIESVFDNNVWEFHHGEVYPTLKNNPEASLPTSYTVTYIYNGAQEQVSVPAGDYTLSDASIFYDGEYDADNYSIITGWVDENGVKYAFGQTVTVSSDLELTAVTEEIVLLADAETRDVIGFISESDDISKAIYNLYYDSSEQPVTYDIVDPVENSYIIDGTRKDVSDYDYTLAFAGWYYKPYDSSLGSLWKQPWNSYVYVDTDDDDVDNSDDLYGDSSKVENHTIYAYWINEDFLHTTLSYYSNAKAATRFYTLSTVPGDYFKNYGFVLSTWADADDEDNLVIGGSVIGNDGNEHNVGVSSKTTVYTSISAKPFTMRHYANSFNGGCGGSYSTAYGANGYLYYYSIAQLALKDSEGNPLTFSARAYYTTHDGTVVYGDMVQTELMPNASFVGVNPLGEAVE